MENTSLLGGKAREAEDDSLDLIQLLLDRGDYRLLASVDSVELVPLVVTKLPTLPPRQRVAACNQLMLRDSNCKIREIVNELCQHPSPEVAIRAVVTAPQQVPGQWFRLCAWLSTGVEPWLACEAIHAMEQSLHAVTASNREVFLTSIRACLDFAMSPILALTCLEIQNRQNVPVDATHLLRVYLSLNDEVMIDALLCGIAESSVEVHALLKPHYAHFLPHFGDSRKLKESKCLVLRCVSEFIKDPFEAEEIVSVCDDAILLVELALRFSHLKVMVEGKLCKSESSVASSLVCLRCVESGAARLVQEYFTYPEHRELILTHLLKEEYFTYLAEIIRLSNDSSDMSSILLIGACISIIHKFPGSRLASVSTWRLSQMKTDPSSEWLKELSANYKLLAPPEMQTHAEVVGSTSTLEEDDRVSDLPAQGVHQILDDFFSAPAIQPVIPLTPRDQLDVKAFPFVSCRSMTLIHFDMNPDCVTVTSFADTRVDECRILTTLQAHLGIG